MQAFESPLADGPAGDARVRASELVHPRADLAAGAFGLGQIRGAGSRRRERPRCATTGRALTSAKLEETSDDARITIITALPRTIRKYDDRFGVLRVIGSIESATSLESRPKTPEETFRSRSQRGRVALEIDKNSGSADGRCVVDLADLGANALDEVVRQAHQIRAD